MRKGNDLETPLRAVIADLRDKDRAMERALTQDAIPAGSGTGTVTSAALTVPSIFSVSGSPITTAGTFAVTLANQSANQVWAGPTGGGAAAPTFRSLVAADIPALSYGTGTVTIVALSLPGIFSVSGSPITGAGTLTGTLATQTANYLWAGPVSGGAAAPTFRAMVSDDIPATIVTYAKIQNMTTARLLGRTTAGAGVVEEISVGAGLTLSGGVLDTAGGAGVTGSGTDTYLTRWTGASTVGDSTLYLSFGKIISATSNSGLKVQRTGADATNNSSADASFGFNATMSNLAVDRDGGGSVVHTAGFSSDSLTENTYVYGKLTWFSDATYDIGASGANRPRDAYLSRSLYAASLKLLGSSSGTATITPPAAAGTPTLTLPTSTGTLALTSDVTTAVSGTSGKLAKFTGTNAVGNSIITESGATLSAAGTFTIVGQSDTNQLVIKGHSTQTSGQIVIQTSAAAELARVYVVAANYSMGIGYLAGQSMTGDANLAIGANALKTTVSGYNNTALGKNTLQNANNSAHDNVAIGYNSQSAVTSGQYNLSIGTDSLVLNTTGSSNVGVGTNALRAVTGSDNVGIGGYAGYYNSTGNYNVFIGASSGTTCLGSDNVVIGRLAGEGTQATWSYSVYIGYGAGAGASAGNYNVGIGKEALKGTVANATAIGYQAGKAQTGAGFVAVGYQAGLTSSSGTNSTLIGSGAGASLTTNGGCVMLGYQAGNAETAANKLYIANSSTTTPLIYGDFSTPSLTFNGSITIQDARNITFNATTGTKIGTATTEKLAFHNSTPVVQRAGAAQAAVGTTAATNSSPYGYTTAAQADAIVALVNEIRAALVEKGLIKGAA